MARPSNWPWIPPFHGGELEFESPAGHHRVGSHPSQEIQNGFYHRLYLTLAIACVRNHRTNLCSYIDRCTHTLVDK